MKLINLNILLDYYVKSFYCDRKVYAPNEINVSSIGEKWLDAYRYVSPVYRENEPYTHTHSSMQINNSLLHYNYNNVNEIKSIIIEANRSVAFLFT